jgi:dihydroorotase
MNPAMDKFNRRTEAKGSLLRVEGRIANHDHEFDGAIEINTTTGLIEYVGPITGQSDLDLSGQIILPGFGDLHIHAREDSSQLHIYKEDFATISAASIHGGVTHVADMPNNPMAPVDDASYTEK